MDGGSKLESTDPINVLHVDDESTFLELSTTFLERIDDRIDVTPASSARDGLVVLDESTIDVVVSDYDMPESDGIEFLRTVRAAKPDLPFILFTGVGSETVASEAVSAGVTDYLKKGGDGDQFRVLANKITTAADQHRTQQALLDEQTRYTTLFENFPEPTVGVDFVDDKPVIRTVNRAFQRTFGVDPNTVVGESLNELIVPEGNQAAARRLDSRAEGGDFIDEEIRRETPDGLRDFLFRNIPIGGDVDHYGVYVDITERKERERELERYTDNLAQLYRTANQLYATDTVEECYSLTIDAAVDILGFDWCTLAAPAEDGIDFEIKAISADTPLEVGDRPFTVEEGLAGHVYQTGEASIVDDVLADGRGKPTDDAIRAALTVPVGTWGIFQAVRTGATDTFDERDQTNAELLVTSMIAAIDRNEHQTELETQNERLDAFAKLVSHDLRNPLNVAVGRLELLADECESEHLDAIDRSLDRMGELIEDLLALARTDEETLAVETVGLGPVVEAAWATVLTDGSTLNVTTDRRIRADRGRLQQLLENLLRNAVEHGGPAVTVTVGDLEAGFYVEDDGPGIPASDRETVFTRGYTTADGGTGLGLSIVKGIVSAHGWNLQLSTGANGGARFEITGVDGVPTP